MVDTCDEAAMSPLEVFVMTRKIRGFFLETPCRGVQVGARQLQKHRHEGTTERT
jgi:hypothetical protein